MIDILTTPEVLALMGSAVVALLTSAVSILRFIPKWIDHRIAELEAHASRAADASERAAYQTSNDHGLNLREDLDEKFASVFSRMDAMETARQDDALRDREERKALEERAACRAARAEKQIDGLRDDLRNMDLRYAKENGRIWDTLKAD